jgi:hypothetical protein
MDGWMPWIGIEAAGIERRGFTSCSKHSWRSSLPLAAVVAQTALRVSRTQAVDQIGLELKRDLFLSEIDVGRQRRLLFGARDDFDDLFGTALLQQLLTDCRQQRSDALQELQVFGWPFSRSGEQQDDVDFVSVERQAVR